MLKAEYHKFILNFKRPSGTSRGVMTEKPGYLITVWDDEKPDVKGIGECSLIPGLSPDEGTDYEQKLIWTCKNIDTVKSSLHADLEHFPSIRFGMETALLDLLSGGNKMLYDTAFTRCEAGITINGLIWMGQPDYMVEQIEDKLKSGFSCLKIKIGAIGFEQELEVLKYIRNRFSVDTLELRVDANGAFDAKNAPEILSKLAQLDIHSIEQPIKAGQWKEMALLCAATPLPIALDEELIGVYDNKMRREMLETIKPQYIILKPSLLGGLKASMEWISLAEEYKTGWWVTSALESNIGLNAIAQWTSTLGTTMPQGLGTGSLYTNNIPSRLIIKDEKLWME